MANILAIMIGCAPKNGGDNVMVKIHESTVQHCVGRNSIELPSSFVAPLVITGIFKNQRAEGGEQPMDVLVHEGISPQKFALEVQKRKAELKAQSTLTVDNLREVKMLDDHAVLFHVQRIEDAYVSEIVFLRGTSIVIARLNSFQNQYLAAEDILRRFANDVVAIDKDKSSNRNDGFCLGSVKIKGSFGIERGSFLFRDGLGAQFEVNIDTYVADDRVPLLDRMSGPSSLLNIFNVRHGVYRARETSAGGMRAQEWLGSAQTIDDQNETAFQFTLETMRPSPGKDAPRISLTFETAQPLENGSQTKTLISKDEAIRLWDSVVASVRPAKL